MPYEIMMVTDDGDGAYIERSTERTGEGAGMAIAGALDGGGAPPPTLVVCTWIEPDDAA